MEREENERDFIHAFVVEVIITQMRRNFACETRRKISPRIYFQNTKFLLLFCYLMFKALGFWKSI